MVVFRSNLRRPCQVLSRHSSPANVATLAAEKRGMTLLIDSVIVSVWT
jgi:hypothetical protein